MQTFLDPHRFSGALVLAGAFVLTGLVLSWLVHRLIDRAMRYDRSERIDQITLLFLTRLTVLTTWVVLATLYAHVIPALDRLGTALLAGVSVMSVVLGFAAQATLGNLIAGISLVLHKPVRRGDRLQIQAPSGLEVGEVEDISLGYTMLKTDDRRQIIIANSIMAQQIIIKLPPRP